MANDFTLSLIGFKGFDPQSSEGGVDVIGELVNQCRMRDRPIYDCEPPRPQRADNCANVEEQWILTICYGQGGATRSRT